jgi:hypothetical protein
MLFEPDFVYDPIDAAARAAVAERQRAYREKLLHNWREVRARRAEDLNLRSDAIKRATDLYEQLDTGEHPDVRVRSAFIRLPVDRPDREADPRLATKRGDFLTRPPLTRLIYRPSNALVVEMTVCYTAQMEFEPGEPFRNARPNNFAGGWADLSGLRVSGADRRKHNLKLTRALRKLEAEGLVAAGAAHTSNRFDGFELKREDRTTHPYTVPGELPRSGMVVIPGGFFRAGWHLVLTAEELATYLIILEQTQRFRLRRRKEPSDIGVALPGKVRWRSYGLAREAYTSLHELEEFGLIDVYDPSNRRRGKLRQDPGNDHDQRALRLICPPAKRPMDFAQTAIDVVRRSLKANDVPPRLERDPTDLD